MNDTLSTFLGFSGNRLVASIFVLVVAIILRQVIKIILRSIFKIPLNADLFPKRKKDHERRIKTLSSIALATSSFVIWFVTIVVILGICNVPIAPLLTSAGLIGAALAFGMQSLIKDFVNGLFVIAENQYRVDDYIEMVTTVAGEKKSGVVQAITIRTTIIKDETGAIHHIPNGSIAISTNHSMSNDIIHHSFTLKPSYTVEQFEQELANISKKLLDDEATKNFFKTEPKLYEIKEVNGSGTEVDVTFETNASKRVKAATIFLRAVKLSNIKLV
jgi:small conductance mechanosensitive channel